MSSILLGYLNLGGAKGDLLKASTHEAGSELSIAGPVRFQRGHAVHAATLAAKREAIDQADADAAALVVEFAARPEAAALPKLQAVAGEVKAKLAKARERAASAEAAFKTAVAAALDPLPAMGRAEQEAAEVRRLATWLRQLELDLAAEHRRVDAIRSTALMDFWATAGQKAAEEMAAVEAEFKSFAATILPRLAAAQALAAECSRRRDRFRMGARPRPGGRKEEAAIAEPTASESSVTG